MAKGGILMPERKDDELRELIRADYVVMGSVNKVAKKHKVSWATVKSILSEDPDELQDQRNTKRKEFIDEAWDVANMYLENLKNPKTVKGAKARDSATVYGILVDKVQKDQELWLKYDKVWEQVWTALEDEMLTYIKEDPKLGKLFSDFLKAKKLELNMDVKEKFENKLKEIDKMIHENHLQEVESDHEFDDLGCNSVWDYESKISKPIRQKYDSIARILADQDIKELVEEYKKRH